MSAVLLIVCSILAGACLYSCQLLYTFLLYNQSSFCSKQLLQSIFIFLIYYVRLVFADETVLCLLYDDSSATDLDTKAVTKVPQKAWVWLPYNHHTHCFKLRVEHSLINSFKQRAIRNTTFSWHQTLALKQNKLPPTSGHPNATKRLVTG